MYRQDIRILCDAVVDTAVVWHDDGKVLIEPLSKQH